MATPPFFPHVAGILSERQCQNHVVDQWLYHHALYSVIVFWTPSNSRRVNSGVLMESIFENKDLYNVQFYFLQISSQNWDCVKVRFVV